MEHKKIISLVKSCFIKSLHVKLEKSLSNVFKGKTDKNFSQQFHFLENKYYKGALFNAKCEYKHIEIGAKSVNAIASMSTSKYR